MIVRGFRFALIMMFFLNILPTDSVAMGIQAESSFYSSKAKDDKEKSRIDLDDTKDSLIDIDAKKDVTKVSGHELGVESSRANDPSIEAAVETSSISRLIFREQVNINRLAHPTFGVQEFSDVGSAEGVETYSYSDHVFSYKNLLEEVQTGLGEGVYGKLVWTYYDLKDLDDRIYASMVGYDLSAIKLLGKLEQFIGVDSQVNAMIVFGSGGGIMGKSIGVGNGENQDANKSSNSKVILDFSQRSVAEKNEVDTGRFQFILKHLTIKSFIYSLLILMGVGMAWRMFRFFIKQDLS
jgi:hypothetical protein